MTKKNKYATTWDDVPIIIDLPYAAHLLGCSYEIARKMCQSGKLKAFKVGDMWRILKDDLVAYTQGEVSA